MIHLYGFFIKSRQGGIHELPDIELIIKSGTV